MSTRRFADFAGVSVLVTGAASGIGRSLAQQLAGQGAVLFLTDVNETALVETVAALTGSGGDVAYASPVDVSDYEAVRAMAAEITEQYGALDIVMNVAGIASWGTISAMTNQTWHRLVDVNLLGPVHVLEEFVPPMIEAGLGGHIVNVSSAAGIIGMPWHAAYSASKFGLRGVSEVLRFDLARHRIGVSLVCPGGVDTGLTETVQIAGVDHASPAFLRARKRFQAHAVTPDQAATAILKGVRRRRYWVYTSPDIRALHLLQRYFPPGYVLGMHVFNRVANRVLPDVRRATRETS